MSNARKIPASFRDPSGFIFLREGRLFRQVNQIYKASYEKLRQSGLYQALIDERLLIAHEEAGDEPLAHEISYKVLRPERVPFISYPYEWCFGQLKAAALCTLAIQKLALAFGMSLKDSSAYNIQFVHGKPLLIDTLSFESYREGEPWVAYRQFCQHFLAPLMLMSNRDVRLNQLFRTNLDGVPLDLASSLLPARTRWSFSTSLHIHWHARLTRSSGQAAQAPKRREFAKTALLGLLQSLESAVNRLSWNPKGTEWADYYSDTNYTDAALDAKRRLVLEFLDTAAPRSVWDLGANTGFFSRIASERRIPTIAFDIDPAAVERNYRQVVERAETHLLPLQLDLTNPSPGLGWMNRERDSLIDRGPAGAVFALALIHHLAISNNVPLGDVAQLFTRLGEWLVIEFVPKTDSQVRRLMVVREDIFPDYTRERFEAAFQPLFAIERSEPIPETERVLYLMRKRER